MAESGRRRDRGHHVHLIVSPLVWCPKRRKAVLGGEIAKACRTLIEEKCAEKGWTILELAIQPEHLHLLVRGWPTDAAAAGVKACKGLIARRLRTKYAVLRRMPSLWTSSYFASTAGPGSSAILQRYLAAQQGV
jgi:putative transposase